jgi:RecA-family ATPase
LTDPARPKFKDPQRAKAWEIEWKQDNDWSTAEPQFQEVPDDIPMAEWFQVSDLAYLPPVQWLVDGLIVHREQNLYLGQSGVGKTAVVSSILWSWLTGQEYWLEPRFSINQDVPVEERRVMYMLLEGVQGYYARAQAFMESVGLPEGALDNMLVTSGAVKLWEAGLDPEKDEEWPESLTALKNALLLYMPQVLVIDTLSRATPGMPENGPEMNLVVTSLQRLINELGITVIIQHHTPKDGRATGRGHGSLDGAMGNIIAVKEKDTVRELHAEKYRYAAAESGAIATFVFKSYMDAFTVEPGTPVKMGRPSTDPRLGDVVGMTKNAAAEYLDMKPASLARKIRGLDSFAIEDGVVVAVEPEDPEVL